MMRILTVGLLYAAAAQPLTAAPFTPAPHAQHMIDLDTAPGHFSVWDARDLAGLNAIRAHFRIKALGRDREWQPVFRFQLKHDNEVVQVSVYGRAGKKPLLVEFYERTGRGQKSPEAFQTSMNVEELADLEIDWTTDGEVSFTLKSVQSLQLSGDGERRTAKLSGPPTGFSVLGSTGEIELQSLALGTTG